ncbi:MAG: hypothetical protein JSV68_07135 [Anaerolineaceae bacterium]|nr:MAG: hypothetical protein JSV68_07135 [Anaerolineaceae bacterium]
MTQKIGETKVEPGWTGLINGCAWGRITEWASITWDDVPEGTHTYWVKLDSYHDIDDEIDETNNIVSGKVTSTP